MGKRRSKKKAPKLPPQKKIKVEVISAGADVRHAMALIKPCLLYADEITILSPVASILEDVTKMVDLDDPFERLESAVQLANFFPEHFSGIDIPPEIPASWRPVIKDPDLLRKVGAPDAASQIDTVLDILEKSWLTIIDAVAEVHTRLGSAELATAMNRGLVKVRSLDGEQSDLATMILNEKRGMETPRQMDMETPRQMDMLLAEFLSRALEQMVSGKGIPLLDAASVDLFRALQNEKGPLGGSITKGSARELGAVAGFMGDLPRIADIGVDEIVDVRHELRVPLIRFRGPMARIGSEMASGPLDAGFDDEITTLWRSEVEPALQEIAELLHENHILRDTFTSGAFTTGITASPGTGLGIGLAANDAVIGAIAGFALATFTTATSLARALNTKAQRRELAEKNDFFFLHRLSSAGMQ